VNHGQNFDQALFRHDSVDHPVRGCDQFAQKGIAELWHRAAKLGMSSQQFCRPVNLRVQAPRRRRLLSPDKRGSFGQIS
jgi:hypothetical protein